MPKFRRREAHAGVGPAAGTDAAAQFETSPCVAVLYERAAWCYMAGGLNRKGALHFVMAGHRYRRCGYERKRSSATLLRARSMPRYANCSGGTASCGWPRIDEHIEHALASAATVQ